MLIQASSRNHASEHFESMLMKMSTKFFKKKFKIKNIPFILFAKFSGCFLIQIVKKKNTIIKQILKQEKNCFQKVFLSKLF